MLTFVLPRFADLFKTLDTALPPTTAFLMFLSHMLTQYWWMALAGLIGLGIAGRAWFFSANGKIVFDTVSLNFPRIGKIIKNFCTARVIRLLGTLIESKVPLIEALQLTCAATTNSHYVKLLKDAEDSVTRGESIAQAFDKPKLIDVSVCEAIRNGERSGPGGAVIAQYVRIFLDEENEVIVKSLTSIIEPDHFDRSWRCWSASWRSSNVFAAVRSHLRGTRRQLMRWLGPSYSPIGLDAGSRFIKAAQIQ